MKRKVLIVSSAFPLYESEGLNNFLLLHASGLRNLGVEVTVLAPYKRPALRYEIINGIHVYRHLQCLVFPDGIAYGAGILPNLKKNPLKFFCIPVYIYFQFKKIVELYRKNKFDTIIVHWPVPQGFAILPALPFLKPRPDIIPVYHGSEWLKLNQHLWLLFHKKIIKESKYVVAVSDFMANDIESRLNIKPVVIPMPVDTTIFKPFKRESSESDKLIYVGNFIESKGLDLLMIAFEECIKHKQNLSLTLVGDGPMKEQLLAWKNKLSECSIKILPPQPNHSLPQLFHQHDIFVFPSRSEGYSLVLREALASGLRCITPDLPVFKNDNTLDEMLHFFENGNVLSLEKKIMETVDLPPLTIEQQWSQWNWVNKTGSVEFVSRQWYNLFNR